jgi:hypothetical protein
MRQSLTEATMKSFFVSLIAALVFTVAICPAYAADKDCSDFSTWRQAQNFYKRHGGPRYDPHRLDADHDGIACESLR